MAVKLDNAQVAHAQRSGEQPEVASCVSGIIEAFTNGLNIFKRLRERRRKRKANKENEKPKSAPDPTRDAEKQLSKSLKKGPLELAEKYADFYHPMGPRFAKGDAIAHASLAETLIKLNTGLVGIIAQFLNHDAKGGKSHLDLDYKSLTHLSDASRREALQSMTQLYHRLSTSQLQLFGSGAPPCPRCGTTKHHDCSSRSTSPEKSEKRKHSSSRQRSSGPVVTRMPIRSSTSNEPRLVVMRPKTTRKQSSSSNNSHSSSGVKSPSSSRTSSPLASPQPKKLTMAPQLPLYVPVEAFELNTSGVIKGTLGGAGFKDERKRIDSFDDPRQPAWTQYPYTTETEKKEKKHHHHHHHHQDPTPRAPTPRRPSTSQQSKPPIPTKPSYLSPPPPMPASYQNPATLPFRRRMDKVTNSSYTFTTQASTQLGEIPQRHWTKAYDYEEAARLNDEAAVTGYPGVQVPGEKEKKEKKKRFGFLRRDA